jgi:transketolase
LVRMEVNTRRRCEQAIAEERAKRRALEEHLKKQAQSARPLLEGLADLFQRANTQIKQDAMISLTPGGSPRR